MAPVITIAIVRCWSRPAVTCWGVYRWRMRAGMWGTLLLTTDTRATRFLPIFINDIILSKCRDGISAHIIYQHFVAVSHNSTPYTLAITYEMYTLSFEKRHIYTRLTHLRSLERSDTHKQIITYSCLRMKYRRSKTKNGAEYMPCLCLCSSIAYVEWCATTTPYRDGTLDHHTPPHQMCAECGGWKVIATTARRSEQYNVPSKFANFSYKR